MSTRTFSSQVGSGRGRVEFTQLPARYPRGAFHLPVELAQVDTVAHPLLGVGCAGQHYGRPWHCRVTGKTAIQTDGGARPGLRVRPFNYTPRLACRVGHTRERNHMDITLPWLVSRSRGGGTACSLSSRGTSTEHKLHVCARACDLLPRNKAAAMANSKPMTGRNHACVLRTR